jgi:hypothetical protein
MYTLLESFEWGELELEFAGMGCNLSQSNDDLVYIHTLLSDESEKDLLELMNRLEDHLRSGGIALNNPRRQAFVSPRMGEGHTRRMSYGRKGY